MEFLTATDLAPFVDVEPAKAVQMIEDATALATLAAPCLGATPSSLSDPQVAAVKAILRGAILRWVDAGSGAFQTRAENIGSYGYSEGYDTRQARRGMFWPSEITQLQAICGGRDAQAFTVDTAVLGFGVGHADICSLNFGAVYCSCGALLASGLLP